MAPSPRDAPQTRPTIIHGNKKHSLQKAMRLSDDAMMPIIGSLREIVKRHFDRSLTFPAHSQEVIDAYLAECSKLPALQRYRDGMNCWPAEAYCRLYLMNSSQNAKASKAAKTTNVARTAKQEKPKNNHPYQRKRMSSIEQASARERLPSVSLVSPAGDENLAANQASQTAAQPPQPADIPALLEFLTSLQPPQPQLLDTLLDSGVTCITGLRLIARDSSVQEDFLKQLPLRPFELAYLRMALRIL